MSSENIDKIQYDPLHEFYTDKEHQEYQRMVRERTTQGQRRKRVYVIDAIVASDDFVTVEKLHSLTGIKKGTVENAIQDMLIRREIEKTAEIQNGKLGADPIYYDFTGDQE